MDSGPGRFASSAQGSRRGEPDGTATHKAAGQPPPPPPLRHSTPNRCPAAGGLQRTVLELEARLDDLLAVVPPHDQVAGIRHEVQTGVEQRALRPDDFVVDLQSRQYRSEKWPAQAGYRSSGWVTCFVAVVTSPSTAACTGSVATPVTEISAPLAQSTVPAS